MMRALIWMTLVALAVVGAAAGGHASPLPLAEATKPVPLLPPSVHSQLASPALFAALESPNARIRDRAAAALNCSMCEGAMSLLPPLLQTNATLDVVIQVATAVCEDIKPMCSGVDACAQLCQGLVAEHAEEVWQLLWEVLLTPDPSRPRGLCVLLKLCPVPPPPTPSTAIPVRSDLSNSAGEIEWPSWDLTTGTGTFVHLSDVHVDTKYTVGSLTQCGLPLCCHEANGPGNNESDTAGYFGNYHCDTPQVLAQSLLDHLASLDPQPDFLLYTGDDPAHDVWQQSRAENLAAIQLWSSMVNETLGRTIPIFHTLGNHASYPVNQFEGPGYDSWLYDVVVDAWAPFLPEDAQTTFTYGGYYQALVRPGLRVISLNSNYFTDDNFWLLANETDAQNQLNWLADVLAQATARNEKAIIICHAPLDTWNSALAESFLGVASQYATTIVNLFMGHTHENEVQILHAVKDGQQGPPAWVEWVGGSVVPFTNMNPGFMLYEYDRAVVAGNQPYTHLVTQAHGYWADLPTVNAANSTEGLWTLPDGSARYNVTRDWGLDSLDPGQMANLVAGWTASSAGYAAYAKALSKGVNPNAPSVQSVRCDILSDTSALAHACKHAAGFSETEIQEMEKLEASRC